MKQLEVARLFLRKAAEDEALLDAVLGVQTVADATFGFHCQQAAEKLLKARLAALGIRFRKTHDLQELMALLEDSCEPLPAALATLDEWTPFAIDFRYDELASPAAFDRVAAREALRVLRAYVESKLAGQRDANGAEAPR